MLQERTDNMQFARRQVLYLDLYLPCLQEMIHPFVRNLSCQSNIYVSWYTLARLVPSNMFHSSSKFLSERYKAALLLWTIFIICVTCLSFSYCLLLWSDTGKGLPPGLLYVMFSCGFVTFPYRVLGQPCCLACIDS